MLCVSLATSPGEIPDPFVSLVIFVVEEEVDGNEDKSIFDEEQIEDEPVRSMRPLELQLLDSPSFSEPLVLSGCPDMARASLVRHATLLIRSSSIVW